MKNPVGRPAGTTLTSRRLCARATPHLTAAATRVAALEGRSLASLVRVSVQAYCRPRLDRDTRR